MQEQEALGKKANRRVGKGREVDLLLHSQVLKPIAEQCMRSWSKWIFKVILKIAAENELRRLCNMRAMELRSAYLKTELWHTGIFEERKYWEINSSLLKGAESTMRTQN